MPVWRYPITGLHPRTVSPSSSSTSRSTPWVEGCCGPMLMIIVSSLRGTRVVIWSRTVVGPGGRVLMRTPRRGGASRRQPLVDRRHADVGLVRRADAAERVVLAERMALPVLRHDDPAEIRVAVERDAEEVEDLPFLPVRGREQARHARH